MSYPWSERFIEVALRSIVKTHWSYQIWDMGQAGLKDEEKRLQFSRGKGIELADETVVCSVITQDALNSPFFSGAFIPEGKTKDGRPIKQGHRWWKINREQNIFQNDKKELTREACDILVQRYDISEDGIVKNEKEPIAIEAKRLIAHTTDNLPEAESHFYKNNIGAIVEDLEKLERLEATKKYFPYILTWCVYDEGSDDDKLQPKQLLEKLKGKYTKKNLKFVEIRWHPLPNLSSDDIEEIVVAKKTHEIKRWIWVALIEAI